MARAWIVDLWIKNAQVELPDGSTQRLTASSQQRKSVRTIPEHFRTARWGRGKRWKVAWYEENKQRSKLFDAKKNAEEFTAELEDDIRMGRYVDPTKREQQFSEVAEIWLSSKGRIKDSTYRRYRRDLDTYVLPRWGSTPIGSVRRQDVDQWVQQLLAGTAPRATSDSKHTPPSKRAQRGLSATSIDAIVRIAMGAPIRYAVKQSWLGRNPLDGLELPRDERVKGSLPTLTYGEVEALAQSALDLTGNRADACLLHLLAYSGLRIGEATALLATDLDPDNARVHVRQTWSTDREGKRKITVPKTWEQRWVPIPRFLVSELQALVRDQNEGPYLLQAKRGQAIDSGNWYNRVWLKIRRGTSADSFSVHDLRHVAATLAIAANADVKLVQQMLGHKDATETLNTYAAVWPSKINEVITLIEERRSAALAE